VKSSRCSSDPLAVFKGPIAKGRDGKGRERKGKGKEGWMEGRGVAEGLARTHKVAI